jgi:hypothetical protein
MILLCEPQCKGLEHVDFNAAVLATVHCAFENEQIVFFAEREHLASVRNRLTGFLIDNVSYHEIDAIGKVDKQYKRALREFEICWHIFHYAHKNGINKVLYCSTTSASLIATKILLFFYSDLKCITIPHSILLTIIKWPRRWLLGIPFWFKTALLLKNPDRLRYLIIGGFTKEWLKEQLPTIEKKLLSIEMPYLFKHKNNIIINNERQTIRFGFFGFGSIDKGIELFIKLSEDIQKTHTRIIPELVLIGNTYKTEPGMNFGCVYMPSPYKPLSTDDYEKYAKSVDYSIILYNPETYNIMHGASIMDSLEYCKPIIAIRSLLVELYFKEMDDIGYLCGNYDELIKTVLSILNEFPNERYKQQCNNILKGRESLLPNTISTTLRKEINNFWV